MSFSRDSVTSIIFLLLLTLTCNFTETVSSKNHREDSSVDTTKRTARLPMNITAVGDISVTLKCRVRLYECGNFFSIEWYKEKSGRPSERVYIYIHSNGMSKSEGSWKDRADHVYDSKRHLMEIELSPTQLSDEAFYRCEITYENSGRWFHSGCLSSQITQLTVMERPRSVILELENKTEVEDGETIGPYDEGSILIMRCKAGPAKPMPQISWWNGTNPLLNAWQQTVDHPNGTGTMVSEVNLILRRENLERRIMCRVNNSALNAPISKSVTINMNLAPLTLNLLPPVPSEPVAEGGQVTLTCITTGAKPAAHIYWNSEPPLNLNNTHEEVIREGYTFKTINRLTLRAEKRLASISCFASNIVMDVRKDMHLKRATTLNVKYKPEVERKKEVEKMRVVQGGEAVLFCKFDANPLAGTVIHWYINLNIIGKNNNPKFERASKDNSLLRINNIDSSLEGTYSCSAENEVGKSDIVDQAVIVVEEKPKVNLWVEPAEAVNELLNANVTLVCLSEKKASFYAVKWYLDGEMLQHVALAPECINDTFRFESENGENVIEQESRCNMDTTKVILVNVSRTFHGNYSCRGRNLAGWGPMSEVKQLKVLYPPQGAILTQTPNIIRKGRPFELTCSAKKAGYPLVDGATWFLNGKRLHGSSNNNNNTNLVIKRNALIVGKALVSSTGNYSCIPSNKAGPAFELLEEEEEFNEDGTKKKKQPIVTEDLSTNYRMDENLEATASVSIFVYSEPTLLRSPDLRTGAPRSQKEKSLLCEVECDPLCSISWFKNGELLPQNSSFLEKSKSRIETSFFPPNEQKNVLMRVESRLTFNLESLYSNDDEDHDDGDGKTTNFTCRSSANRIGPSVEATTFFRLHYPPRKVEVTPRAQTVYEKSHATSLKCSADSFPDAKFQWTFQEINPKENLYVSSSSSQQNLKSNPTNLTTSSNGQEIDFSYPISRRKAGLYTCTAFNDLGQASATASLKVFFRPKCGLDIYEEIDNPNAPESRESILKCEVQEAEPMSNLSFSWFHNDRRLNGVNQQRLHLSKGNKGSYACQVSNLVGKSDTCSMTIGNSAEKVVAQSDYSMYLVFGIMGMTLVFGKILLVVYCFKRHSSSFGALKLDLASSSKNHKFVENGNRERGDMQIKSHVGNGTLNHNHNENVCVLSSSDVPSTILVPSSAGMAEGTAIISPPPYARIGSRKISTNLSHNNNNICLTNGNQLSNSINRRVRMRVMNNHGSNSIECADEDTVDELLDPVAVTDFEYDDFGSLNNSSGSCLMMSGGGRRNGRISGRRRVIVNELEDEIDYGHNRPVAPRELWLV